MINLWCTGVLLSGKLFIFFIEHNNLHSLQRYILHHYYMVGLF